MEKQLKRKEWNLHERNSYIYMKKKGGVYYIETNKYADYSCIYIYMWTFSKSVFWNAAHC